MSRVWPASARPGGYTLVELLLVMAIGSILLLALLNVVMRGVQAQAAVQGGNELAQQAHFAMQQMLQAVGRSTRLMLPQADRPASDWPEHIRKQTVPASPPTGSSTLDTAVLAVTQDPAVDLDANGIPDADNDGDGRIDEDWPVDITNDGAPGIYLVDDGGDGTIDEYLACCYMDDDEHFGITDEDELDGLDNDNDGRIDEDPRADMNGDGCPGVCAVDEDADGAIDEGGINDDDEDGSTDEDWLDPVVFYLNGSDLQQRIPVPWDVDGNTVVDGRDFIVETIASNVTRLQVERVAPGNGKVLLVALTLELTDPVSGETVSLTSRMRVGSLL